MLKFDLDELHQVAAVVAKYNPSFLNCDIDELVSEMQYQANLKPGYVSTKGYVLTTFKLPGGGLGVKASVSASLFSK